MKQPKTSSFATLPAHESIVARASDVTGKTKNAAALMSAIFAEAATTKFPKNHDVIDVALRSMRRRLIRAKIVGPDAGKKRMARISLKLVAEKIEAVKKATEKAADKTHASGGKTKGVIAIEEAAIVSVINGYGPGTPKAVSLLVGWATLLVPQDGDGYPAVELDEPGIMADAFKAAGERLKGFLNGKQAEIIEDATDYLETLAAGKVNEPVGEPFSAENPMPMTRAAIRGVTVNDPARTREFQVGGGDSAAARRTLDEGECLETSPQRAAETH